MKSGRIEAWIIKYLLMNRLGLALRVLVFLVGILENVAIYYQKFMKLVKCLTNSWTFKGEAGILEL